MALLSNSPSNVQITHSNVRITNTNIQRYYIFISRTGNLYGGIFYPRSLYRPRRFAELCAKTEGKISSVQTDQARLISILLNGYIYNGIGNDKKSENHSKSFNGARMTLMNIWHFPPIMCNVWQIHSGAKSTKFKNVSETSVLKFQDQSKQWPSSSDSLSFTRRHFLWAGVFKSWENKRPKWNTIQPAVVCCSS